jgi:hypothetical protein
MGEGFKEETPDGNQEKGSEEGSEEEETLTNRAGRRPRKFFLQEKLASATSFPEAFRCPLRLGVITRLLPAMVRVRRKPYAQSRVGAAPRATAAIVRE